MRSQSSAATGADFVEGARGTLAPGWPAEKRQAVNVGYNGARLADN